MRYFEPMKTKLNTPQVTFDGITGNLFTFAVKGERTKLVVESARGFAVIGTFANEPKIGEVLGLLARKGII